MILYPALDLMDGGCVRLNQGRFEEAVRYASDPAEAIRAFARDGAEWTHVVDLDGARAGRPVQHELLARLAREVPLNLQVAGGFRERAHLEAMYDAGVARVVIGSLAVKAPDQVSAFFDLFGPDRIVLALDVRIEGGVPMVAVGGWTQSAGRSLWEVAGEWPQVRHVLITDIGRDGMLAGPNVELVREAVERLPGVEIQASGGVAEADDLGRLAQAGAAGAVVGKALWEGRISVREALAHGGA